MQLLFCLLSYIIPASFYTLQFNDWNGASQSMNQFQNKKILLVNIASSSPKVNQLADLQALQNQYGDSLAIIVFPSNSFGNEPKSDSEIKEFCQLTYAATFFIAEKKPVSGINIQPVYKWITDINENGVFNDSVKGDFQKFLIDKNGELVSFFSGSTRPIDPLVINAITGN